MKYIIPTIFALILLGAYHLIGNHSDNQSIVLTRRVHAQEEPSEKLPNIILIITDDQRYDDFDDVMPITKREIFDKGIRFNNAFVTTPACCPSRSSIFTGLYTSGHAVRGNRFELNKTTFIEHLQESYFTGLVGKYLNFWDGTHRPEFDYWVSMPYGASAFYNPTLNVNGVKQKITGYSTYIFKDAAIDFLEQSAKQEKPFMLVLAFNAPHFPYQPALEDRNTLIKSKIKKYPSLNEVDKSDKPIFLKNAPSLSKSTLKQYHKRRVRQRECLLSVDRSVGKVLEKLDELGANEDTLIMYISDNGVLLGEHGAKDKDTPYDEAVKVPFGIRYPKMIKPAIIDELVANIDIAPTIYDVANTQAPEKVHGSSLFDLFKTNPIWRTQLLLEGFRNIGMKRPFAAVRTKDFLYVRNMSTPKDPNFLELYDLNLDPYQLNNRVQYDKYAEIVDNLDIDLDSLLYHYRGSTSFDEPKGILGEKWR